MLFGKGLSHLSNNPCFNALEKEEWYRGNSWLSHFKPLSESVGEGLGKEGWGCGIANVDRYYLFPKGQILNSSTLKEFAKDNFKFDENGGKISKRTETQWEKEIMLITSNFSFSHSVFRRHVLQTSKKKGLFGKRLSV